MLRVNEMGEGGERADRRGWLWFEKVISAVETTKRIKHDKQKKQQQQQQSW